MTFEKMCNLCNVYPANEEIETKRVILYYPFSVKSKRYIYVKLESHPVFDMQHLTNSAKTYLPMMEKEKSDNKTFTSRRENKALSNSMKLKDDAFNVNRVHEGIMKSLNSYDFYNTHVRKGSEFFVSGELLNHFFQNFLIHSNLVNDICNAYNPNRDVPRQLTRRSKSKSLSPKNIYKKTLRQTKKLLRLKK